MHTESPAKQAAQEAVPSARISSEPAAGDAAAAPLAQRVIAGLRARFRLHTEEHEPPAAPRLFGMTLWAAMCVFVGLIPAGRLVVALAMGDGPWWYPMMSVGLGVLGLGLITAAFGAIHRAHLPWYLLGVATILLAGNVAMVYTVF